jgi:hypothetical protein
MRVTRVMFATGIAMIVGMAGFALPAAAASTAVLTVGSLGGPNVSINDDLKSGLKAGTSVTFGFLMTCAASTINFVVTANPPAGGVAKGTVTPFTFGNCTSGVVGATCASATVNGLPYTIGINGGTGTITLTTPSVTLRVCTGLGTVTCAYTATSFTGWWSNMDNSMTFSGQFTKSGGPGSCPNTFPFSIVYAPVRDTSVVGSPVVFAQ